MKCESNTCRSKVKQEESDINNILIVRVMLLMAVVEWSIEKGLT